eukprot:scpid106084/ scgid10121/ 
MLQRVERNCGRKNDEKNKEHGTAQSYSCNRLQIARKAKMSHNVILVLWETAGSFTLWNLCQFSISIHAPVAESTLYCCVLYTSSVVRLGCSFLLSPFMIVFYKYYTAMKQTSLCFYTKLGVTA